MAKRGATLTQRIKGVVDEFNQVQEIAETFMDAMTDPSDLMRMLLSGEGNPMAGLTRANAKNRLGPLGNAPGGVSFDRMHLMPKQYQDRLGELMGAGFDIDRFTADLERKVHRRLVHGQKSLGPGGVWNWAWGQFLGFDPKTKTFGPNRSKDQIMWFTEKMLGTLF